MHALTVQQPWAEAIARHGKTVENRTRRPPAHLLGQRIAIHVSQSWDAWDAICADGLEPSDHPKLPPALLDWMDVSEIGGKAPPPHAGRIIATARLVGTVRAYQDHNGADGVAYDLVAADPNHPNGAPTAVSNAAIRRAMRSPWFVGPVGWVLADVRALAEPVGQGGCWHCGGHGDVADGAPGPFSDPYFVTCERCGGDGIGAIRGQVYPFALSPEVEAAVLRQEEGHV